MKPINTALISITVIAILILLMITAYLFKIPEIVNNFLLRLEIFRIELVLTDLYIKKKGNEVFWKKSALSGEKMTKHFYTTVSTISQKSSPMPLTTTSSTTASSTTVSSTTTSSTTTSSTTTSSTTTSSTTTSSTTAISTKATSIKKEIEQQHQVEVDLKIRCTLIVYIYYYYF